MTTPTDDPLIPLIPQSKIREVLGVLLDMEQWLRISGVPDLWASYPAIRTKQLRELRELAGLPVPEELKEKGS